MYINKHTLFIAFALLAATSFGCGGDSGANNNGNGKTNITTTPNGNTCDKTTDSDCDGVPNTKDNCPTKANKDQSDTDGNGVGDVCENKPDPSCDRTTDSDCDGVPDSKDNCPSDSNPKQEDSDGNGVGDVCESPTSACQSDIDGDGICDDKDSCFPGGLANYDKLVGEDKTENVKGLFRSVYADTNNDGLNDLIVFGRTPSGTEALIIYKASESSDGIKLEREVSYGSNNSSEHIWDVMVFDTNGDKKNEIIAIRKNGLYYVKAEKDGFGQLKAKFSKVNPFSRNFDYEARGFVGDFNNDSKPDFVIQTRNHPYHSDNILVFGINKTNGAFDSYKDLKLENRSSNSSYPNKYFFGTPATFGDNKLGFMSLTGYEISWYQKGCYQSDDSICYRHELKFVNGFDFDESAKTVTTGKTKSFAIVEPESKTDNKGDVYTVQPYGSVYYKKLEGETPKYLFGFFAPSIKVGSSTKVPFFASQIYDQADTSGLKTVGSGPLTSDEIDRAIIDDFNLDGVLDVASSNTIYYGAKGETNPYSNVTAVTRPSDLGEVYFMTSGKLGSLKVPTIFSSSEDDKGWEAYTANSCQE